MIKFVKKKWAIFIIFFTVVLFTLNIIFAVRYQCDGQNIFTAISGWVSGFSTLVIGTITYILTIKIDNVTKEANERRDNEIKQQNEFDLKLRANPSIYFSDIVNCNISYPLYLIVKEEFVNRLTDNKPIKEIEDYYNLMNFDIVFKSQHTGLIENIKISHLNCSIERNNKKIYTKIFANYSSNGKANLKMENVGEILAHVDLLTKEKIEVLDKGDVVSLFGFLRSSNSFGVYKDYEFGYKFKVIEIIAKDSTSINFKTEVLEHCMWANEVNLNKGDDNNG